jgi:hypothetical protein
MNRRRLIYSAFELSKSWSEEEVHSHLFEALKEHLQHLPPPRYVDTGYGRGFLQLVIPHLLIFKAYYIPCNIMALEKKKFQTSILFTLMKMMSTTDAGNGLLEENAIAAESDEDVSD